MRTFPSILSILLLSCLVLVPLTGCQSQTARAQTPSQTAQLALPLIDEEIHGAEETAYFAMGWFWGSDSRFGSIDGVIRTRVGYAGGTTANPIYTNIGNHTETVQVDYDPAIVSYEQLLSAFWDDPGVTYSPYSIQYRAAIMYTTDRQQVLAEASKTDAETRLGKRTYVSVEPVANFYTAEDYHQKYYLRENKAVVNSIYAVYPDAADFRDSTAVARLNGYLGGFGNLDNLKQNLTKLGLNETGQKALLEVANSGLTPACPVVIPGG